MKCDVRSELKKLMEVGTTNPGSSVVGGRLRWRGGMSWHLHVMMIGWINDQIYFKGTI